MANPTIPPGSLVLVTGVNGYIATHIADTLLRAGYRVRGSVRSASRSSWLRPLFESRHGQEVISSGRFEIVEVPDLQAVGAWDSVFADGSVAAVASVASGSSMSLDVQDVDAAVAEEAKAYIGLLEAAHGAPGSSVRSVVFTSSAWACYTPDTKASGVLTADSWNELALELAADQSLPSKARGFYGIMAMKVGYEKKVWEWVRSAKPAYAFNVVMPDTVFGPVLDPNEQGGSTAGLVRWLWDGKNTGIHANMPPQWFIDVRDVGKMYLAALTLPGLNNSRFYGFAKRYSWPRVLAIMKELYPQRTDWPDLPEAGWDAFEVPTDEAEGLIKQIGDGKGWVSLEDSIRDTVASFLAKDENGGTTLATIQPKREAFA